MGKPPSELLEPKKRGRPRLRLVSMKLNSSIDADLIRAFDLVAKQRGLSRAQTIEAALRRYMEEE